MIILQLVRINEYRQSTPNNLLVRNDHDLALRKNFQQLGNVLPIPNGALHVLVRLLHRSF